MFVRPHLDYADIIYDRPNNELFKRKLEPVQYNAALAITGAITGTSRDKIFNELGIEYLADRRWLRRLTFFYKIQNGLAPLYLKNVIPQYVTTYRTRNLTALRNFPARTDLFSFSFFPHTIRNWNSLDPSIRNLSSVQLFKNAPLKFIRPSPSPLSGINHPFGIKLLSCLRFGLSHLREHKFCHNFLDIINPLCSCNIEPESTSHFLLHCHFFSEHRKTLFDSLKAIDISIIAMSDKVLLISYFLVVICILVSLMLQ